MGDQVLQVGTRCCPICGQHAWLEHYEGEWRRASWVVWFGCAQKRNSEASAWLDGWDACVENASGG